MKNNQEDDGELVLGGIACLVGIGFFLLCGLFGKINEVANNGYVYIIPKQYASSCIFPISDAIDIGDSYKVRKNNILYGTFVRIDHSNPQEFDEQVDCGVIADEPTRYENYNK